MVKIHSGKPNWPLLTLAALSFIPGFGFLIGAAAITWALITSRSRARLALAIAAIGFLGNIVLSVLIYRYAMTDPATAELRRRMVAIELGRVVEAVDAHKAEHGRYPSRLEAIVALPKLRRPVSIFDQSAGISFNPKPFQYIVTPDGEHFGLFAVGADGEPWTEDDILPELTDSVLATTGWVRMLQENADPLPPDAP